MWIKAKCCRCRCDKNKLPCHSCCRGTRGRCMNPYDSDAGPSRTSSSPSPTHGPAPDLHPFDLSPSSDLHPLGTDRAAAPSQPSPWSYSPISLGPVDHVALPLLASRLPHLPLTSLLLLRYVVSRSQFFIMSPRLRGIAGLIYLLLWRLCQPDPLT